MLRIGKNYPLKELSESWLNLFFNPKRNSRQVGGAKHFS